MKKIKLSESAANMLDNPSITIFWFRRDLRLNDNAGLYHALAENPSVLPLFIFDPEILQKLEDKSDRRVAFIYQTLAALKSQLETLGSSLLVLYGNPEDIFNRLRSGTVYANHDYEPYSRRRDTTVHQILNRHGSTLRTFKDHVIFERNELLKNDGKPYTVFTPYSRKWKSLYTTAPTKSFATEEYFSHLVKTPPFPLPSLESFGFEYCQITFPPADINLSVIGAYDNQRDFPSLDGTTHLSVHIRFGTLSIRSLALTGLENNDTWLNELIWRDFYHMILWHFPHVATKAFKPSYELIDWANDPDEFNAWCTGNTGFPFVDAGMRELNATGFMHNRVRMVTASFLTKHLLIDWRWGEAYFAAKLLDFDLAANNGGWQWAAGSGCDAAPYFRIFNPELQAKKFDPTLAYINKWVPELNTSSYPAPIVSHKSSRERALRIYKEAVG